MTKAEERRLHFSTGIRAHCHGQSFDVSTCNGLFLLIDATNKSLKYHMSWQLQNGIAYEAL
jgi:hypothetical protein